MYRTRWHIARQPAVERCATHAAASCSQLPEAEASYAISAEGVGDYKVGHMADACRQPAALA